MKRMASYVIGAYSGLSPAVWFFALVTLVNRAGTMVLPFLTLYVSRDLGYSITFAGVAMGVFGLGAVVGSWLGGWMADRFGVMRAIFISFIGAGSLFMLLEHVRSKPLFLSVLLALGTIGEAYRPASSAAFAMFCTAENRARAFALQRLAINLGMTLGPALGGFLAERSYAWLFRVDGATCLLAAFLLVVLPLKKFFQQPVATAETREKVASPLKDRGYLFFLFLTFLSGVVFFQLFSLLPLYLNDAYGINESGFGALIAVNCVIITLFEMTLIRFVEHMQPMRVIGAGCLFVGLGFFVLPFGHGFGFAVFSMVIWTIGEMLTSPMMSTYVANRAKDENRGAYMGMLAMAFSFAYIAGPMAGSLVYQHFGGVVLWTACLVVSLLTMGGFEWMRILERKARSN